MDTCFNWVWAHSQNFVLVLGMRISFNAHCKCIFWHLHNAWSGTWIESMVVIKSQLWGICHWFVFKQVCVHIHDKYLFLDYFWITYIYRLIPKLTNHINKKVDILWLQRHNKTYIKKFKKSLCVPQRICQYTRLFLNNNLFIQRSWKGHISLPATIKSLRQNRKVYLCIVTSSKWLKNRIQWYFLLSFLKSFNRWK